jgi:hypothetical protein
MQKLFKMYSSTSEYIYVCKQSDIIVALSIHSYMYEMYLTVHKETLTLFSAFITGNVVNVGPPSSLISMPVSLHEDVRHVSLYEVRSDLMSSTVTCKIQIILSIVIVPLEGLSPRRGERA